MTRYCIIGGRVAASRRPSYPAIAIWLLVVAILNAPKPAEAFVPTLGHVRDLLTDCPGASSKAASVINGEVFAFLKSSMSDGFANLLVLGSTFVLSKNELGAKEDEYSAYTECATQRLVPFLERIGVKIIRNIGEQDREFQGKNLTFLPSLFFDSVSAYQAIRVSKDLKTVIEFGKISCEAKFSVPYVVYPLTSYQPGYEPSRASERPISSGAKVELSRDSPEIAAAIRESEEINDKEPRKSGFQNYVSTRDNELWVWIFLTSKEKTCSASVSVREQKIN